MLVLLKSTNGLFLALCLSLITVVIWQPTTAQAEERLQRYNIDKGALSTVLSTFAAQSGLLLSADATITQEKQSAGLQGEYTIEEGLRKILADSDLDYKFTSQTSVKIVKLPPKQVNAPIKLPEIIVTGETLERDLQNVYSSVNVYTGDDLDRATDKDLNDVILRTPNTAIGLDGRSFSIRGVDVESSSGADAGAPGIRTGNLINVQVDNAQVPTWGGPFSTWDLEQVEILKGPQGTNQGRNALAGAVIFRTADPSFEPEAKIRASYGSNATSQLAAAISGPIVDDTLAYRVAIDKTDTDGSITNTLIGSDKANQQDNLTARVKLLYESDISRLEFGYSRVDRSIGSGFGPTDNFPDRREIEQNINEVRDSQFDIINLEYSHALSKQWELISTTTYVNDDNTRVFDGDTSAAPLSMLTTAEDATDISQEFRFEYDSHNGLRGVIGLYYSHADAEDSTQGFFDGSFFGLPSTTFDDLAEEDVTNYALFGELDWWVTDSWQIIAGLRWDNEEVERSDRSFSMPVPVLVNRKYDALLPSISIAHHFNENLTTAFTIKRGYRAGGAGQSLISRTRFEVDPEFATNYEFALRSVWLDGQLTLNGSIFFTDWKDQQVQVSLASASDTILQNAGESESYGLELSADLQVNPHLVLFADLGLLETEFTRYQTLGFGGMPNNFTGNEFANAPSTSLTLGLDYQQPNGFFAHVDASYRSDAFSDAANIQQDIIDAYTLVNVKVGYQQKHYSVGIFTRNLFDEDYETFSGFSTTGFGEERIVGVEINGYF